MEIDAQLKVAETMQSNINYGQGSREIYTSYDQYAETLDWLKSPLLCDGFALQNFSSLTLTEEKNGLQTQVDTLTSQKADLQKQVDTLKAGASSGSSSGGSSSDSSSVPAAYSSSDDQSETVYVTDTGSKYHSAGCRYLKKSQIPMSLSEAKRQGYTACSVCGG